MRGRVQIALSIAAFLVGLTVLFGRLLLDFDEYVSELESRAFERAGPKLSDYEQRLVASTLVAGHVSVADAGLIWAAWDLETDDGARRFRGQVQRLASEDGTIASLVVWLNEGRIDEVRAARLDEARERSAPRLEALDPNQARLVRQLWDQHEGALLGSLIDLNDRIVQARGEQWLVRLEDRVRSSLRGTLLPTEEEMRAWMEDAADECELGYVPSLDHYSAQLRAVCSGRRYTRQIVLPRLE